MADEEKGAFVTGATGFVGGEIAAQLKARGIKVTALVRPGGAPPAGIAALEADLNDPQALADRIRAHAPRFIVHAAGRVTADSSGDRGFYRDNLDTTVAIAEAVRQAAMPVRLVCIGSAAQYGLGTPQDRATRETDPMRPVSAYGASKAAALLAAHAAGERYGFDVVSIVLFNLIGPGQPHGLVPAAFIGPAIADPAATLQVGNVTSSRDFIDIRDAAAAVIAAAFDGRRGAIYNAGRGEPARVETILGLIRDALGGTLAWDSDETRFGAERVPVSYADVSSIRADTGWQASIGLAQSIADMIAQARAGGMAGR